MTCTVMAIHACGPSLGRGVEGWGGGVREADLFLKEFVGDLDILAEELESVAKATPKRMNERSTGKGGSMYSAAENESIGHLVTSEGRSSGVVICRSGTERDETKGKRRGNTNQELTCRKKRKGKGAGAHRSVSRHRRAKADKLTRRASSSRARPHA